MNTKFSKAGKRAIAVAAALVGVFHSGTSALAINFVWQGAAGDGNWNSNSNWFNMSKAATATTFPGNTSNLTANAVFADSVFDFTTGYYSSTPVLPTTAINIPASGIELDTISFGDAESNGDFTLSSNISIGSATTTITLNTTSGGLERLGTGQDGVIGGTQKGLSYPATSGKQTILSNLVSNANQTWTINGTAGEVLVDGTISNSTGQTIIKGGGGELEIASNNSAGLLGGFIAQGGITLLDNSYALGAGTSAVQLASTTSTNPGSLLTSSGVTFARNVVSVTNTKSQTETLGGASNQSSSLWTGNIALNYPVSITGGTAGTTTFSGILSDGTGGTDGGGKVFNFSSSTVTKVNTGTVVLSASNTYSGGTNVAAGVLTGTVAGAFGSGSVVVNPTGTSNTSSDAATVNTTYSIAPAANVTVNSNSPTAIGTINFNGTAETIGSLSGTGSVVLTNPGGTSLTTGNATNTLFSGIISDANGSGSLVKVGTGVWTLSGSSTYGGGTDVSAGTLLVTNKAGSATGSGPVAVGPSAQLGGGGFISGAVTVNGTVAPGLANTSSATTLTIGSGSILAGTVVLDLTAANASDEIAFTGAGTPNFGGTLDVVDTTGFALAPGQSYTLLGFAGNGSTGAFSAPLGLPGLPQGLSWNTSSLYQSGTVSIMGQLAEAVWASGGSTGNWEDPGNWAGGSPANYPGQSIAFGDTASSVVAITLTAGETAGSLNFNSSTRYTAYTLSGNTLTLSSGSTAPAQIMVSAGAQTINVPIALTAGLNINTATGSSLTIGGTVNGGSGALTVSSGSSVILSTTGAIGIPLVVAGNVSFANNSGGSTFLVRSVPSLNLSGGVVSVAAGGQATRQLLSIAGLSGTGLVDLANNDLQLRGGGATGLAQVNRLLQQGYAGGNWQASAGITSSAAAADTTHLTALGVILNDNGSGTALYSTFDSNPTSDGDVLVKYTYYGDTNLDGVVDGSDYSRIDNAYLNNQNSSNPQLTGWYNGDFNNDGVINGSDYTLIDNAFNTQGASLAAEVAVPTAEIAGGSSAVPEPAIMGLFGIGVVGLLGRREDRRSRRRL